MTEIITLNKANYSDYLEPLCQLQISCFSDRWSDQQIEKQLTHNNGFNMALLVDQKLVGFLFYQVLFEQAEIMQVAINPANQGQGLAAQLISQSLPALVQQKIERVLLEVRESNIAAIKLYHALGFHLDGMRKNYYPHPEINNKRENALLYTLHLAQ